MKAIDVAQEISGADADQRAGLLRRRHDPRHARWRCWRRAARQPVASADAADHPARLRRHRRCSTCSSTRQSVAAREAHDRAAAACSRAASWRSTFSFLRANDLVWNYVVGNYLKGETPPAFDLLYWNSDATNLPGPMYCWYLRNTYLENNLREPGKRDRAAASRSTSARSTCRPIIYALARRPHRAVAGRLRARTQLLGGKTRFVLGAIGPHRRRDQPAGQEQAQLLDRQTASCRRRRASGSAGASEHPGSWWTDWSDWLEPHAGKQVAAPKSHGNAQVQGDRARARPLRQGEGLTPHASVIHSNASQESSPWKTSSSSPPPAPPSASSAASLAKIPAPELGAHRDQGSCWRAPGVEPTRSAKSSWARC